MRFVGIKITVVLLTEVESLYENMVSWDGLDRKIKTVFLNLI